MLADKLAHDTGVVVLEHYSERAGWDTDCTDNLITVLESKEVVQDKFNGYRVYVDIFILLLSLVGVTCCVAV